MQDDDAIKDQQGETQTWYVYALKDPRTDAVRYVGCTTNLRRRLLQHRNSRNEQSPKSEWIRDLLQSGSEPVCVILETGDDGNFPDVERRWIAQYIDQGEQLTNREAKSKEGPKRKVVHFSINEDLWMQLRSMAILAGISASEALEQAIEAWLAHENSE